MSASERPGMRDERTLMKYGNMPSQSHPGLPRAAQAL